MEVTYISVETNLLYVFGLILSQAYCQTKDLAESHLDGDHGKCIVNITVPLPCGSRQLD